MLNNAWTFTPQDALGHFGTNPDTGLTDEQVRRNREAYGENCESCGLTSSPRNMADNRRLIIISLARVCAQQSYQTDPCPIQRSACSYPSWICCSLLYPGHF